ncbi:hypothetical protein MSBR2_0314 [Methanosarcina barkeri 227]|uniref:Uncharacterized protein n=1 Tax=Methanosarcina barkeri 227 TaxID=1434106 RepID=A0A0E3R0F2_METBA|nr:hypothetical protein MSBR2_0314 [Methanosarcina barkeri 227]
MSSEDSGGKNAEEEAPVREAEPNPFFDPQLCGTYYCSSGLPGDSFVQHILRCSGILQCNCPINNYFFF